MAHPRTEYARRYRRKNRAKFIAYSLEYRLRNAERIKERNSQPELREAARKRASDWYYANRERALANVRWYTQRTKELCRFCHLGQKKRGKLCCWDCLELYGRPCKNNPSCGIRTRHKHCPCGMAVTIRRMGHCIEPCAYCRAEMERLGAATLEELYQRADGEELAA